MVLTVTDAPGEFCLSTARPGGGVLGVHPHQLLAARFTQRLDSWQLAVRRLRLRRYADVRCNFSTHFFISHYESNLDSQILPVDNINILFRLSST